MYRRALLLQIGLGAWAGMAGVVHAQAGYDVKAWSATRALPRQLLSQEGKAPLQLADFQGRAVLINFWASWCEPCRQEMPSLQQLSSTRAHDLVVLTVNFKDVPANVETFVAQTGMKLPVLRDPDGVSAQAFGVRIFPSTVLIDADGVARSTVRGGLDWMGPAAQQLISPLVKRR